MRPTGVEFRSRRNEARKLGQRCCRLNRKWIKRRRTSPKLGGVIVKQQLTARQTDLGLTRRFDGPISKRRDYPRRDFDTAIRFGRFCVRPRSRQLFADGQQVEIGSRAFDLLVVLLNARGTLVTKEEIIERLWPSTVVEECNLRQQMAFLRKALGDYRDVIKTIPGRGYIFAADADTETVEARGPVLPDADSVACLRKGVSRAGAHGASYLRGEARHSSTGHDKQLPPTVAIIDDDQDVREALKDFLQAAGLRVVLFASIQEFQNSACGPRPECLVLDIMLPGRNGLDFHAELARARVDLPVVFISGHADIPMSVRAMKAGAVEFLTKPVRHQDLLDAIYLAIEPGPPTAWSM
jgi:DNA-binding response OmpR family regulator